MADYHPAPLKLQEQDLRGKVAIITGATKGIGRATALHLATRGASILGTCSSPQSLHLFDVLSQTITDLYSPSSFPKPTLKCIAADILDLSSVRTVLDAVLRGFQVKKVDILVLNAAYNVRPRVGEASSENVLYSLTGNLHWPIALVESLVREDSFNPNSRVVLLSSDRVRDPSPGSALFNATKAGLESLARSWTLELPPKFPGTTVNAVSVGLTDTPGLRSLPPAAVETIKAQRMPKVKVVEGGRIGCAEDVADVVGWLVSEKARWVSGSVVAANGGAEWIGGSS